MSPVPAPAAADRDDVDAMLQAAAAQLAPVDLAAALAAHRTAATTPQTPQSVIPDPTFPRDPARPWLACSVARYACPRGCGWFHDEPTDDQTPIRLVMPADPTPDDITAAITAHANDRADRTRRRIEAAITEHFDGVHSGT